MSLSLQTHTAGDIALIACSGRIVDGDETAVLYKRVCDMLPIYHFFVLDLADVAFIDSAGLGLLVRLLSRVKASAGDLKLCGAGPNIEKTLSVTRLKTVLGSYSSEAEAIAALYQKESGHDLPVRAAVDIVCMHSSKDVLAYLRELLRQAGYAVMTTTNIGDALTLIRATEPKVVVMETALRNSMSGGMPEVFAQFTQGSYVIDLPSHFATEDAGDAGARLLDDLKERTPLGR